MALPVLEFSEAVANQQSRMQSSSGVVLDFTVGSIMGAVTESNAGLFMWLQSRATALLADTRLTTSKGLAVDSFIQQFDFYRYTGGVSSGIITVSRNTTTIQGSVPVDAIVSVSNTNNLNFQVTRDTENPDYDTETDSYILSIGVESIDIPVECQTIGVIGNVLAGEIDTIDSFLVGVDFVTNETSITNGVDPWSDEKTKTEFVLYIQGLVRATEGAIYFAVYSAPAPPQVQRFNIVQNKDHGTEATHYGYFYVVVDDGTGVDNATLISNVSNRVEAYRGLTIAYDVIGPERVDIDIECTVTLVPSPTKTNEEITALIENSISGFINGLSFNSIFPYTRVADLVYDADDNIINVTSITVNGGTSDIETNNEELMFSNDITVNYA